MLFSINEFENVILSITINRPAVSTRANAYVRKRETLRCTLN